MAEKQKRRKGRPDQRRGWLTCSMRAAGWLELPLLAANEAAACPCRWFTRRGQMTRWKRWSFSSMRIGIKMANFVVARRSRSLVAVRGGDSLGLYTMLPLSRATLPLPSGYHGHCLSVPRYTDQRIPNHNIPVSLSNNRPISH